METIITTVKEKIKVLESDIEYYSNRLKEAEDKKLKLTMELSGLEASWEVKSAKYPKDDLDFIEL